MRTIERTNQLKRDYKREMKGKHRSTLEDDFRLVIMLLVSDQLLPERYRDHALTGNWREFRDCHIKPDLVLIYQKPDEERLVLARLGSHGQLGL
ncbi:MAG TPA: type II toxin-antitoxin system YafQ family toxin [Gallionellaceae bacterium]|nr:type II toxin-antitoxin system YafQ family toxin [Gallionellaceae bacterium]